MPPSRWLYLCLASDSSFIVGWVARTPHIFDSIGENLNGVAPRTSHSPPLSLSLSFGRHQPHQQKPRLQHDKSAGAAEKITLRDANSTLVPGPCEARDWLRSSSFCKLQPKRGPSSRCRFSLVGFRSSNAGSATVVVDELDLRPQLPGWLQAPASCRQRNWVRFAKKVAAGRSYRLCFDGFRRRKPGPPPFSSMNSTPAASNARLMTSRVARRG